MSAARSLSFEELPVVTVEGIEPGALYLVPNLARRPGESDQDFVNRCAAGAIKLTGLQDVAR